MRSLRAAVRSAAGVASGDEIDVGLARDSEPRAVVVRADFAAALDAAPERSVALLGEGKR